MNDQSSAGEEEPRDYGSILGDSEDSGEELSAEGALESSWERLPVLERLGLSSMEMTDQEVEDSFVQLALAFRFERTKDTLQSLKVRCQDRERKEVLEKLELSLESIGGTVEGIITAAEQLGTVHQEARVTHAVELMVSHVDNLNRRHATESSELDETRRLVYKTRGRFYSDSTDDVDMRHCLIRQPSQQYLTRRRVSVTLIPTMAQINDQESKLTDSVTTNGDTDSTRSERVIGQPGSSKEILLKTRILECTEDGPPVQQLQQLTNSPQGEDPDTVYLKSPLQDALCHRRKCVAAKEVENADSEEYQGSGTESECQFSDSEDVFSESSTPLTEQRPPVTWLCQCYWTLFWIFLMALYLAILLGVLLWRLRAPLFWL
ncbi:hypothetical protein COCON_G00178060 [Conger conger]|uniref:Lymphoid-restricted membrane protein-like n=1 Tax=Conger conger TaxID=82655 RepID=A0A9Q1HSU2_CONCO|nr:hypothetical protein COCON_G00178060 [Conger conger]